MPHGFDPPTPSSSVSQYLISPSTGEGDLQGFHTKGLATTLSRSNITHGYNQYQPQPEPTWQTSMTWDSSDPLITANTQEINLNSVGRRFDHMHLPGYTTHISNTFTPNDSGFAGYPNHVLEDNIAERVTFDGGNRSAGTDAPNDGF